MGSVGSQIKLIKQKIVKYVKSTIEANIQGGRNQGAPGGFSITNFLRMQLWSTMGHVPSPYFLPYKINHLCYKKFNLF